MEYPAHIKSGQARCGYANGYCDAKAGREPRPYAGKITRAAYAEGYKDGSNQ
jgi:hypothetical protein